MTTKESALATAEEALESYRNMRSPFADDWAELALDLKIALRECMEVLQND